MLTDPDLARWQAFHVYYHDRQDLLLERLLRPLVAGMLHRREIDSFFFVRSILGGPHIRLRLRQSAYHGTVSAAVEEAVQQFFRASPSRTALREDDVRKRTLSILQSDPTETDDHVYPDNSVWSSPFRPEAERYGGPKLLTESLAFFAVSSCEALRFLHQLKGEAGPRLLPFAFHLLGTQALGFAHDPEELLELLHYPVRSWDATPPLLVERADQVFAQQKAGLGQVLRHLIDELVAERLPRAETAAARRLAWTVHQSPARRRILSNQLHMTANRLGLRNAEEVYVTRLLWRTATALECADPELWDHLRQFLEARAVEPAGRSSIEALLPAVFEDLGR
jgi:Lantibiotic biosynthesis dehydratase C-term